MRVMRRTDSRHAPDCGFFLPSSSGDHRYLHSFPTRRSSDLGGGVGDPGGADAPRCGNRSEPLGPVLASVRSEEHTSELQSRGHLVCRLLLEKKKKRNTTEGIDMIAPDPIMSLI